MKARGYLLRNTPLAVLVVLILISVAAAYYKYVGLQDYVGMMHTDCDPASASCFAYLGECEEGQAEEECAYYYTPILVEEVILRDCSSDDGSCLINQCEANPGMCEELSCSDQDFSSFGIYDGCSE